MIGRDLNSPNHLLYGRPPEPEMPGNIEDYVNRLRNRLNEIHEFAGVRMRVASDRMKCRYDVGTTKEMFEGGDAIWFYNPQRKKGVFSKVCV